MQGVLDIPPELTPVVEALGVCLARVTRRFDEQLDSDLPAVVNLVGHVERYRGKMLRPNLVLLSGMASHPRAAGGVSPDGLAALVNDGHISCAAVCEMVHMATLVHDDVLDEAQTRRKGLTVNRLHGNEPAVILGDYLIAGAFELCSSVGAESATAVARASMAMCAGELLQLHHREDLTLDEPTYREIIRRKTAELIAVSCRLGAMHSGAGDAAREGLSRFGMSLGMAFQIQDDVLDLIADEAVLGKPVGKDAEKGKPTLPIIHHLRTADAATRGRTLDLLTRAAHQQRGSGAALRAALDQTGSLGYARNEAARLVGQAKDELAVLPPSAARSMLSVMADAVVTRVF